MSNCCTLVSTKQQQRGPASQQASAPVWLPRLGLVACHDDAEVVDPLDALGVAVDHLQGRGGLADHIICTQSRVRLQQGRLHPGVTGCLPDRGMV